MDELTPINCTALVGAMRRFLSSHFEPYHVFEKPSLRVLTYSFPLGDPKFAVEVINCDSSGREAIYIYPVDSSCNMIKPPGLTYIDNSVGCFRCSADSAKRFFKKIIEFSTKDAV